MFSPCHVGVNISSLVLTTLTPLSWILLPPYINIPLIRGCKRIEIDHRTLVNLSLRSGGGIGPVPYPPAKLLQLEKEKTSPLVSRRDILEKGVEVLTISASVT